MRNSISKSVLYSKSSSLTLMSAKQFSTRCLADADYLCCSACGKEFPDNDSMMAHLYNTCTDLSKGTVKCLGCGKVTKIGRFHANMEDCNETPSCKNRITSALSPLLDHIWPPSSPRQDLGHVRKEASDTLHRETEKPPFELPFSFPAENQRRQSLECYKYQFPVQELSDHSLLPELSGFQPPNYNEHANSLPSELCGAQIMEMEATSPGFDFVALSQIEARSPAHATTKLQEIPLVQNFTTALSVSQPRSEQFSLERCLANGAGATTSPIAQHSPKPCELYTPMTFHEMADTTLLYRGGYNINQSGFVTSMSNPNSDSSPMELWTPSTDYSSTFDVMETHRATSEQGFSSVDSSPISYNFDTGTERNTRGAAAQGASSHTNDMDGISFFWGPQTGASHNSTQFPFVENELAEDMEVAD
jgi:hypothetical protein